MTTNSLTKPNSYKTLPDQNGHFGLFGGRFVAETLMPLILEVEKAYDAAKADPAFQAELDNFLEHYVGRPSPLYFAQRLTEKLRPQLVDAVDNALVRTDDELGPILPGLALASALHETQYSRLFRS